MARALYVAPFGEGHVNPTIGLVRELVTRGEEIVYYSNNKFKAKIESTGAEFRPTAVDMEQLLKRFVKNGMFIKPNQSTQFPDMLGMMETIADKILEETKHEMYDYILYDAQTLAGTWIAKRLNLPSISTWTVFASISPSQMMKQMLEKNKHLMERFNHMKEQFLQSKERIEAKYGIALAPPPQSMMCEGDLNIVFTSQHLQGDVPQSGAPYLFVGPSIADRKDQGDFPIHKLKEGPVVFISLGTIANNHPAFYRLCFEALNDLDALVVLSIGNNLKVEELEPFPDNFIVRNYVPQLDVLRHADAFVTHCGMNSTHEGLYYHVPLVMLPLVNDQPIVAERVKQLGAGILLDFNHLDAATLKNAVGEALSNPVYKRNAQRIGKSFREAGGYVKAADEILKFVNQ